MPNIIENVCAFCGVLQMGRPRLCRTCARVVCAKCFSWEERCCPACAWAATPLDRTKLTKERGADIVALEEKLMRHGVVCSVLKDGNTRWKLVTAQSAPGAVKEVLSRLKTAFPKAYPLATDEKWDQGRSAYVRVTFILDLEAA